MTVSTRVRKGTQLFLCAVLGMLVLTGTGCKNKRPEPMQQTLPCDGGPCEGEPYPPPAPTHNVPSADRKASATSAQISAGDSAYTAGVNNGFNTLSAPQVDALQTVLTPQGQVNLLRQLTPEEAAGLLRQTTPGQRLQFVGEAGAGGMWSVLDDITPTQLSRFQNAVTPQEWQNYQSELASGGYSTD